MDNAESRLLSAVLKDKQIHVLMQANVESLLTTHVDVWEFIKKYTENNSELPPANLVRDKFPDFSVNEDVGATKYHLEEVQSDYLNNTLKEIIRSAASDVQDGKNSHALEELINQTSELKKNTSVIKDIDATDAQDAMAYFEEVKEKVSWAYRVFRQAYQGLTTTYHRELCLGSSEYSLLILALVSPGYRYTSRYRLGSRASPL